MSEIDGQSRYDHLESRSASTDGGFENDLPPAWQVESAGAAASVSRATDHDADPDYEVLAEKGTGNGFAKLNQTIVIPATDANVSLNAKMQATATSGGPWAAEGMDFVYAGENAYIDHLNPTGDGFALFSNSSPAYDCGIAADAGTHRTVGTSFEFSGLQDGTEPSTKATLTRAIMDFFQAGPSPVVFNDDFESGDSTAWSATVP